MTFRTISGPEDLTQRAGLRLLQQSHGRTERVAFVVVDSAVQKEACVN